MRVEKWCVAVYGDNGTKYATYTYDAWGNQIVTYYNGGGSIFDLVYSGADFTNNFENVQAPSGVQVTIGVGVGIDVHFRQSYTVTTFQYR